MDMKITLLNENGDPCLIVTNSEKKGLVYLQVLSTESVLIDTDVAEVDIEDLKHALRKICAK